MGPIIVDEDHFGKNMVLNNVKVLDLTQLLPGPFCSKLLMEFGAEVLKIENPEGGDLARRAFGPKKGQDGASFHYLNGNKKSMTLNLKSEEGIGILFDLAKDYDVILESSRPGTMEKVGLNYDKVKALNPKIIYCSLSAYGHTGPYKEKPGHDLNIIGLCGILDMTGHPGESPSIPGVQIADIGSGLYACIAILIALMGRERTGIGQYIDISMLDSAVSFLSIHAADFFASGQIPQRGTGLLSGGFACYNIYPTKDAGFMTLVGLEPHLWREVCLSLGFESWIPKQFELRAQEEMKKELNELFIQRTMSEWVSFFKGKDVLCEPVMNIEDAFTHPQVMHRGLKTSIDYGDLGSVEGIGVPIKFSDIKTKVTGPAPSLGQHTIDILKFLGRTQKEIETLKDKKIV